MSMFDTWFQTSGMSSLFETFGEEVTFEPANGDQPRKITVTFTERQRQDERDVTLDTLEEYEVELSLDTQDENYGGVSGLMVNDKLYRSEANDADLRPFAFNGEIIAKHGTRIRGVFVRTKRVAQGRSR